MNSPNLSLASRTNQQSFVGVVNGRRTRARYRFRRSRFEFCTHDAYIPAPAQPNRHRGEPDGEKRT